MKTTTQIILAVLVTLVGLSGSGVLAKSPKAEDTKAVMAKFLSHLEALKNYFMYEDKFTDAKNAKEISYHLKAMRELSKKSMHNARLDQENYKLSREVARNPYCRNREGV